VPTTAQHGVAWRRPGPSTGCCISTMVDLLSEQGLSWVPSSQLSCPLPGPQNGEPQLRLVLSPTRQWGPGAQAAAVLLGAGTNPLPSTSNNCSSRSLLGAPEQWCRFPYSPLSGTSGWVELPTRSGGETLQILHVYAGAASAFHLLQGLL
jgi:hypothetical protein